VWSVSDRLAVDDDVDASGPGREQAGDGPAMPSMTD
jgi:hypothetical protein